MSFPVSFLYAWKAEVKMESKLGQEVDRVGVGTVDMMAVGNDETRRRDGGQRWITSWQRPGPLPACHPWSWSITFGALTHPLRSSTSSSIVVNCTARSCHLSENETTPMNLGRLPNFPTNLLSASVESST